MNALRCDVLAYLGSEGWRSRRVVYRVRRQTVTTSGHGAHLPPRAGAMLGAGAHLSGYGPARRPALGFIAARVGGERGTSV